MAIVYPLMPPSNKFARCRITPYAVVGVSKSPLSLAQQVQAFPGQQWQAEYSLPPLREDDGAEWSAFLTSLNGREGTFLVGDSMRSQPRGTAAGSLQVYGANQTGRVLALTGGDPSVTGILKAGDYFHMLVGTNYRLHMCLTDTNSDGGGVVYVDIWPFLRESPANGTPIITDTPVGQFRLMSNSGGAWDEEALTYGISIACEEAI